MTTGRILDHVANAAAWRSLHGVSPWIAALILALIALWIIFSATRQRR